MADYVHEIYRYLNACSIKHSNLGYTYLFATISTMLSSEDVLKITEVYQQVAEAYQTTRFCVERAIRYTITGQNATSKEFIMTACHEIRYGASDSSAYGKNSLFSLQKEAIS